jgi:hypothetical protein
MYEAIVEILNGNEVEAEVSELVEFCNKEIEGLDKKAAKAKENAEKRKAEGDVLMHLVLDALDDEFAPIADIAARIDYNEDATVHKVAYRLNQLVKMEKAEKSEVVVEGGEGQKSRKVVAYRKI